MAPASKYRHTSPVTCSPQGQDSIGMASLVTPGAAAHIEVLFGGGDGAVLMDGSGLSCCESLYSWVNIQTPEKSPPTTTSVCPWSYIGTSWCGCICPHHFLSTPPSRCCSLGEEFQTAYRVGLPLWGSQTSHRQASKTPKQLFQQLNFGDCRVLPRSVHGLGKKGQLLSHR